MTGSASLYKQQGLSLVELMIGLLIGLVLLGGVLQTMLASREASNARQNMVAITDNARFLFDFLGRDLRMAGRGCDDAPSVLSCSSSNVSDNGILELDGSTLRAAYMVPDGDKVVVAFGFDDDEISYTRTVVTPSGSTTEGPSPLVDRIGSFDIAFGYTSDKGDSISYTSYDTIHTDVEEIISLRIRVGFVPTADFSPPPIVSTITLRNRVAKLITP
jgi:Tfp pilus assembly protein PilE